MAPHLEQFTGNYKFIIEDGCIKEEIVGISVPVSGTEHKTGDTETLEAFKAHELLSVDPDNFREVGDELGEPCDLKVVTPGIGASSSDVSFSPKEKG